MNRLLLFTIISAHIVPLFCGTLSTENDKDLLVQRHFMDGNTYSDSECIISEVNPKGMETYYKLTKSFMNSILEEDLDLTDVIYVKNSEIYVNQDNLNDYILSLKGLIALAVCLIIIFVFHLVFSLVMCFIQCCCKPNPKVSNKKGDFWPKIIWATLLFLSFIVLFLALVGAFASNEQLNEGIENVPDSLKNSMNCFKKYLTDTKNEFLDITLQGFSVFLQKFSVQISESETSLNNALGDFINEANTNLNDFESDLNKIPGIYDKFDKFHIDSLSFSSMANEEYNLGLSDLLSDIKDHLHECGDPCKDVKTDSLTEIPTDELEFDKIAASWQAFGVINGQTADFVRSINDGKTAIDTLNKKISKLVEDNLDQAKNEVQNAGDSIKQNNEEISNTLDKMISLMSDFTDDIVKTTRDYTDEYHEYIHGAGIVISILILIVVACLIFALIFGIFCKQPPNSKSAGSCSTKSTGATLLSTMANLVLILAPVLVVITVFLIPIGMLPDRLVCYPFWYPNNSKIMTLVNEGIDISNTNLSTNLKDILEKCNQNESAYNVFELKRFLDLDKIKMNLNIDEFLKKLDLNDIINADFSILNADDLEKLKKLTEFDVLFDFNKFTLFNEKMQKMDLSELIKNLEKVNNIIFENDIETLKNKQNLLLTLKPSSSKLTADAEALKTDLGMGKESFAKAMEFHIDEISKTTKKIQEQSKDVFKNEVTIISQTLVQNINTYVDTLKNDLQYKIGKCMPLSMALNGALSGVCDRVLLPLNGLWISFVLFEIVSIPLVIIALILAGFYRRTTELPVYQGKGSEWHQLGKPKSNYHRYRDASQNVHNNNYY